MLELTVLAEAFTVVRLGPADAVPEWAAGRAELVSVTRTADELSLVVPTGWVPREVPGERGFRALKIVGPLPFELTGILASVAGPLADAGISIFAVSTFDTDYVLVREHALGAAVAALRGAGFVVA